MSEREVAKQILKHLQDAWNNGDGNAYADVFEDNATFINIRADYHRGKEAIAKGHQFIFDTIYKGSEVQYESIDCFALSENILLAISGATLNCPSGPLAGKYNSRFTMVLRKENERWLAAAFHNTLVMKM